MDEAERVVLNLKDFEYYRTDNGVLYCGDCLEILPRLAFKSKAIITDPPFAFTGGISNGSSANTSEQFFRFWWKNVCSCITGHLEQDASGFIWCDWKTAKIISDGFEPITQTCDFYRISQMLYHFREMPGMGKPFRSSVDMIAYMRGPKHKEPPISADTLNHISEYWYYGKHEFHPSEKSVSIVKRLLAWCSVENDMIIDPFSGSCTVAVACEQLKRKWVCIELEKHFCAIAKQRIENERKQMKIF